MQGRCGGAGRRGELRPSPGTGGRRPSRLPTQESESLRLAAFETYSALLAKVKGTYLAFPLKHQVLNLLVLLVLHLADRSVSVVQVRGRSPGGPVQRPPGGGALGGASRDRDTRTGRPPPAPESCRKGRAPGSLGSWLSPAGHRGTVGTPLPSLPSAPTQACPPITTPHAGPGLPTQVCRPALRHAASILGWSRLKPVFAERDIWTILTALVSGGLLAGAGGPGGPSSRPSGSDLTQRLVLQLKQEAGKALWFLRQSVALLQSPQAPHPPGGRVVRRWVCTAVCCLECCPAGSSETVGLLQPPQGKASSEHRGSLSLLLPLPQLGWLRTLPRAGKHVNRMGPAQTRDWRPQPLWGGEDGQGGCVGAGEGAPFPPWALRRRVPRRPDHASPGHRHVHGQRRGGGV